jgi:hypothetical protein
MVTGSRRGRRRRLVVVVVVVATALVVVVERGGARDKARWHYPRRLSGGRAHDVCAGAALVIMA